MNCRFLAGLISAVGCVVLGIAPAKAQVKITPEEDVVRVEIDGKPFTNFVKRGGDAMKPYLHALRAPSGKIVTRHFPMEKVEGEPADHQHQRGLWFGHEKVNGFDFWNNEANYKTQNRGRIEVVKIDEAQGGNDSGTLRATMNWNDPNGAKLLEESRTMIFRRDPKLRIIDFDFTLTAATTVTFGDSKDGLFGVRLAASLQEAGAKDGKIPATGQITNAEGLVTEKAVWGKPSPWVDYSGRVDDEKLGLAIFDHPQNSRPARWHVRGYGLFAANPFGMGVFGDKSKDGSVTLDSGEKLRFRYRVVIHPGDPASADIAALWKEYLQQVKQLPACALQRFARSSPRGIFWLASE